MSYKTAGQFLSFGVAQPDLSVGTTSRGIHSRQTSDILELSERVLRKGVVCAHLVLNYRKYGVEDISVKMRVIKCRAQKHIPSCIIHSAGPPTGPIMESKTWAKICVGLLLAHL